MSVPRQLQGSRGNLHSFGLTTVLIFDVRNTGVPLSLRLPCSCADESIDEIAAFLGVGEQVAAMTAQ